VVALVLIGLVYSVISFFYLGSFRASREPGTVLIGVGPGLADEAERLGLVFSAGTGWEAVIVQAEAAGLGELLASGEVDCVLAGEEETADLPRGAVGPVGPPLRRAYILSVTFPSPHVSVSLVEAETMVADLRGGRPGPWPEAGLELIELFGRSPGRQLLEVDGVYPTLATVTGGTYPLTEDIRLFLRPAPRGLFGLPAYIRPVREWVQPNDAALRDFVSWLDSDRGKAAFYGTAREVSLTCVGDIWFARNVAKKIEEHGLDYPMALVADRLRAADITWCNLESPLGTSGSPLPGKLIWFRARPETVQCLEQAGIDVVALANNHILDYDSPCLLETLEILESRGIAYCGAGQDLDEARRPVIVEAGGLKVAFLAYTEYAHPGLFWDASYPRTFMAGEDLPGCAPLDMEMVAEDIARARSEADVVVVGYHWGREDLEHPTAYHPWNDLQEIARQTIDLGACLVLGTHPHAVQGYEVRGNGLIAYSLGNFVTDQIQLTQREGVILEVRLGPCGVLSARIVPVWSEGFRPEVMDHERGRELLEKIERISRPFRQGGDG